MVQLWQSAGPGMELALTKYLRNCEEAVRLLPTGDDIGAFFVSSIKL